MATQQNPREYEGWTNYETWLVAVWIGNDEDSSRRWTVQARDAREAAPAMSQVIRCVWTAQQAAEIVLADALKAEYSQGPVESGFYADLINAALAEVDWRAVARDLLED